METFQRKQNMQYKCWMLNIQMQYKNVTYRHKQLYEQSNTTDIAQIAHPPDVKGTVHSSTLHTHSSNAPQFKLSHTKNPLWLKIDFSLALFLTKTVTWLQKTWDLVIINTLKKKLSSLKLANSCSLSAYTAWKRAAWTLC